MSTIEPVVAAGKAHPTSTSAGARRGALQSGFSLLARAEPQIWFTGGMLAVCLAMVLSLLTLILASGLPTFWQQPVDWLALRDGSLDVGEAKSALKGLETTEANGDLAGTSYYYRTENFDLTNTHYRWFKPSELMPAGIVRVPATTLIERFEWGHLYGIPLRIHDPIEVSESDRQQIDSMLQIARTLQALVPLVGQNADGQASAEAAITGSIKSVEDLLKQVRNKSLRRSMAEATSGVVQYKLVDDGEWLTASGVEAGVQVDEVRKILVDSDAVRTRLAEVLPQVSGQRRRVESLKDELSRLDVQISRLRIGVRQAELDTLGVLPLQLDGCHGLLEQLSAYQELLGAVSACKKQIPTFLNDASQAEKLVAVLDSFEQKELPAAIKATAQELDAWRQPLAAAPPKIQSAVTAYERGYAEMIIKKQPIQVQLTALQAELNRGELIVCVPNGAKRVEGVSRTDALAAAKGIIKDSIAMGLKDLGTEAIGDGTVDFAGDALSVVSITDAQKTNHLLAITSAELLSGENSARESATAETQANDLSADESHTGVNLLAEHPVAFSELVRVIPVNELSLIGKLSVYFSRWGEFLFEDPREANTLGGVFPAIWGTIVMTLIMTIAVVPFGVMAALYLREYTKGGTLVSIIRISINNLAGVPSIVYGVFGFSFFCMTIGSYIDGGPRNADIAVWPSGTWYLVLWITVVIGTAAFLFSFFSSGPIHSQTHLKRMLAKAGFVLWLVCLVAAVGLIAKSPFFDGFYTAQLPNPTFGKGGLLWASLTLALLTLPVVIVATEEALAAVPNSLREGSLACGASKWQTIRRIVLPHARPGILTGAILAMARGAGEVAPLMLVGALPNAPELPLDGEFPFFHGSRNFMHLGYQIYSLGFQSQNSEAAKPMVFTCTLLLILIVAALNIVAIFLRTRLRRRFQGNQF